MGKAKAWRMTHNGAVLAAFTALVLVPWAWSGQAMRVSLAQTLEGPSWVHPLGTDNLGRDLLARLGDAAAGAVLPLWAVVVAASVVGLALALAAILAEERGRAAVRVFDTVAVLAAAVPVGLAAFGWAAWRERAGLGPVMLALGVLFAVRTYLQVRDLHRHDRYLAFWTAHVALGGGLATRLWRYGVLGGWREALLDGLGFHLRAAVAIEASLSYLGFGVEEPHASFGNMLASHLDLYLNGHWYVLAVVATALALAAAFPPCLVRVFGRGEIG